MTEAVLAKGISRRKVVSWRARGANHRPPAAYLVSHMADTLEMDDAAARELFRWFAERASDR